MEAYRQEKEALRTKVELFEQIPEVATEIRKKQLHFSYKLEQYVKKSGRSCFSANWLNGAWWAWGVRQAEIDEKDKRIEEALQKVDRIKESFNQGKIVNFMMFLDDLEGNLRGERE